MSIHSCLYAGQVFHRRTRPREHVLRYRVFSWLLDLDEIDTLAAALWPLSRNRFNLFAFHDADFGERPGEPLDAYVRRQLAAAGIAAVPARILLGCYPRVLGRAFNPLSLFWCLDAAGRPFAVVHEVHNTFGERHAYTLPVDGDRAVSPTESGAGAGAASAPTWIRQSVDKALFVSPFNAMELRYEFRLAPPAERQVIVVRTLDAAGPLLTASYTARRLPLDTPRLLGLLVRMPLMASKVIVGIHAEALRLWLKGVPRYAHGAPCPASVAPRPAPASIAAPASVPVPASAPVPIPASRD